MKAGGENFVAKVSVAKPEDTIWRGSYNCRVAGDCTRAPANKTWEIEAEGNTRTETRDALQETIERECYPSGRDPLCYVVSDVEIFEKQIVQPQQSWLSGVARRFGDRIHNWVK